MDIGERIKGLRKKLGLTQKAFAQHIGKVDYTYIGKIERGEQYPSLKMLKKIGEAFSVPLGYFFENSSFLSSMELLPGEVRKLLKDRKRQNLVKISQKLTEQDLSLIMQITNILIQKKPLKRFQVAEKKAKYESLTDKRVLIEKIEKTLTFPPSSLSLREDWLREALKIALQALKRGLED
ncbi:MAG: helix-turn-helix transcriptional regulator [Candidatus Aerophobetes bacterium]|nr:helix-turn-helix transcriptional regulator [Candidatus Aerophobetes bacterium]